MMSASGDQGTPADPEGDHMNTERRTNKDEMEKKARLDEDTEGHRARSWVSEDGQDEDTEGHRARRP